MHRTPPYTRGWIGLSRPTGRARSAHCRREMSMPDTRIELIEGGSITSVSAFMAAGVACGLKPNGALDLALVCSEPASRPRCLRATCSRRRPSSTTSARPHEPRRGVVINSGCANACTGDRGLEDAAHSAALVAEALGAEPGQIFVMSTGVIGQHLPMTKIAAGIRSAAGSCAAPWRRGTEPPGPS